MTDFKNIPFARILVPFVLGIACSLYWKINTNVIYLLLVTFIAMIILHLNNRSRYGVQQNKWLFVLFSDLFLFLSAIWCCYWNNIQNHENFYGHYLKQKEQVWVGEILELPVEKEHFYKVLMEVNGLNNSGNTSGKVLVYFKKPMDKGLLEPGNKLGIKSSFNSIPEPLNPNEFNYKDFMARKNIYYTGFADKHNCLLISKPVGFSLIRLGLSVKKKIINVFTQSPLNKDAAQLCIALLTGYDDEINPETINAFAHSGTLHVLSVSGLHTGILYGVLIFFLGIIDKNNKRKLLQLITITVVLWMFVFITGFSPPVLRAAIMLNLIAAGRFYYSYTSVHTINILAVSAFILLLSDPLLILDTGFLLSYSAVTGILLFEPGITQMIESRYWIINKVWQLTSVSLAAQIATLPITLFLFHQFPLWFMFSNLVVIPLCILVMALALLILLKLNFLTTLVNLCSSVIFYIIHLTDSPGAGYIDHIDFGITDAVFLTAFILVFSIFIRKNSYRLIAGSMILLIAWQLVSVLEVFEKKSSSQIVIYHIKKQTALDVKDHGDLLFFNKLISSDYNYHVKNNHTFYNYPNVDSLYGSYVKSANNSLLVINSPKQEYLIRFLKPHYLLVTESTELDGTYFKDSGVKLVVSDGSNNYASTKKLKTLCDKFGVPFYSTAQNGYLQIAM